MKYLSVLILTISCSTTQLIKDSYKYGEITKSESKVDQTIELYMYPVSLFPIVGAYSNIGLGAFWKTNFQKGKIHLKLEVIGAETFKSITFRIDDKFEKFSPELANTIIKSDGPAAYVGAYRPIANHSTVTFEVSREMVEKLINAKQVFVKAEFLNSYTEAAITIEDASSDFDQVFIRDYGYPTPKEALRKLLNEIDVVSKSKK